MERRLPTNCDELNVILKEKDSSCKISFPIEDQELIPKAIEPEWKIFEKTTNEQHADTNDVEMLQNNRNDG
ncbi:29735_t:CDS:2 [Gigaspora margarita]|uniref:29735_t:CDS:1 n=1 Tax=Gigaspora margarita TaxID=4874 RepID=A0ABN7VP21_GIGMA|nr:29735_t:CDS:2 [Gigaspora margarita]